MRLEEEPEEFDPDELEPEEEKIVLSDEQNHIMSIVESGRNVFVGGSGGVGKSVLLREIVKKLGEDRKIYVTGSTGVAAINVGGCTLHSYMGFGIVNEGDEYQDVFQRTANNKPAVDTILATDTLIIDEISMIDGRVLDVVEYVLRRVRANQEPFGGIQVVFFGDFLQLPPVEPNREYMLAYLSRAWRNSRILCYELTRIFRQNDEELIRNLNKVRFGEIDEDATKYFKQFVRAPNDPDASRMFARRSSTDNYNRQKLNELEGPDLEFPAEDTGMPTPMKTLQKNCIAPDPLIVRPGAKIMTLKNIKDVCFNGMMGRFLEVNDEKMAAVDMEDCGSMQGGLLFLEKDKWELKKGKIVLAKRVQYPLILAWALTIHKSQGATLDKMYAALSEVFEAGQAYVALSRVRTAEGIHLDYFEPSKIYADIRAVKFHKKLMAMEMKGLALKPMQ